MESEGRIAFLHEAFRSRRLSPVEVARDQLKAMEERDSAVNAFCFVDAATTIRMAQEAEARFRSGNPLGPLDGLPISLKDTLNVAGWPTRRGSRTTSEEPVGADAISVQRLREAGAVFLGKTTTPEFAWKGVTDSPLTGITRNPHDLSLTAGGSSGGAAAAIALGLGTMAVGTDAAGSVRIPAAFCGAVGFKPTFGRIPLDPYPAGFSQMPHIGPIAATVVDAAIGASIMAGPAAIDWTSLRQTNLSVISAEADDELGVLRIGVQIDIPGSPLAGNIAPAWNAFLAKLRARFRDVRDVSLPFPEARDVAGALYRIGCADAVGRVAMDRRDQLDPELLEFIEPASGLTAEDVIALFRRREEIAAVSAQLLGSAVDVIITPTMAVAPPAIEGLQAPGACARWLDWNVFTPLFNLAHGPAISVPWPSGDGLPIGIQVAAAPGRDGIALRVAREIERLSDHVPARFAARSVELR